MKNLKPLYVKARFGGPEDAKIYAEGVKILLEESPVDFLRNLPSILVSNVGCDSCLSFIERYGLSVEAYKIFAEEVDKVLESKQGKNKDTSKQETVKQKVQEYEDDYLDSIEMYEYYTCTNTMFDEVEYLETYYGVNERGILNNRLVIGMLDKYGEAAIPDLLIKAHSINEDALNELCNVIFERYMSDEKIMQFCYESLRQLSPENMNVSDFYFQTAERRVKEVVENVEKVRDEYIMLGESGEDVYLEFGPFEQNAISDYMDVAEYKQITHPTEERSSLMEKVLEIQLVLEEYAAYTEEWMDNPHHQKTGEAPNYLMADHDLDLGELPAKKKKDEKEEEEEEEPKKHLDDFKRTSTDDDLDDIDDKTDDVEDDAVGVNDLEDVKPKDVTPPAPSGNVNNYYYYNYTNSNNKISNSHNKDSHNRDSHDRDSHDRDSHAIDARQSKRSDKSVHSNMRSDDRSVKYSNREDSSSSYSNRTSSTRDDHSVRDDHSSRKDDHSQYKRASAKKREAEIEESVAIFEAGIRDTKEWKGECRAFYSLFKQDLNKLGDIKDPEPNIIIVIDGVKMSFSTSLAKEKDKENVLKLYAQVPTSIHQYNANKAKFEKDTIGIGKAIVKYVSDHVKGVKKTEKPSAIIRRFKIKPRYFTFALYGNIILTFSSNIKGSEIFAVHVSPQMKCKGSALDDIKVEAYSDDFDVSLDIFEEDVEYISEQVLMECVEEIQYLCEGASDAECKKFISDCKKIGIIVGKSYGDMAGELNRTATVAHRAKNDKSLFPTIAKFIKQYRRKDDFKEDMAPRHHTGTVFDFILRMDRAGGPREYLKRLARAKQPFVLTNDKRTVEFLNACNRAGINAGRNFGTGDKDKSHVKNALRVLKKHPEKAKKSMKIIEGFMKGKDKASFGKIMDQNLISHNRLLFGFLDRILKKGGLEKYGKKMGVKMESLEFDSDFDPIFEDGDDEKKDEGKKGGNFKSGWDKFKKGVIKVVKKILGFLHLKKLLSALEKFDEPAAIDNKIVLTYVGTNIPIELKGEGVQESFDLGFSFDTTDDIDWLLENGWTLSDNLDGFFFEDGDGKKALNEQELMAVLEELKKKHDDVKWLFIKPEAAEDVKQAIGPASCLKINGKTLDKLKNNESLIGLTHDDTKGNKIVIAINPTIITNLKLNNKEDITKVVEHEYGHAKTFANITDEMWLEYKLKRQLISGLMNSLPDCGVQFDRATALAESNMMYYKLKVEDMANKSANIDAKQLNKIIIGRDAEGNLPGVNTDKLVNYQFQNGIIEATKTNYDNIEEMWEKDQAKVEPLMKENIALFNTIITDEGAKKKITGAIEAKLNKVKNGDKKEEEQQPKQDQPKPAQTPASTNGEKTGTDGAAAAKPDEDANKSREKSDDKSEEHHASVYIQISDLVDSYMEAFGDVDDGKPKSDNWVRDTAQDIQVKAGENKQKMKKGVQEVQSAAKSIWKPFKTIGEWFKNLGSNISTSQEKEMKEDIVNPSLRRKVLKLFRNAVLAGSVAQAGLMGNWLIAGIFILGWSHNNKKKQEMRNDIIFELSTEMKVIDEKIRDLDASNDPKDRDTKYKLMRLKGELNKKLHKVAGNFRTTNHVPQQVAFKSDNDRY